MCTHVNLGRHCNCRYRSVERHLCVCVRVCVFARARARARACDACVRAMRACVRACVRIVCVRAGYMYNCMDRQR